VLQCVAGEKNLSKAKRVDMASFPVAVCERVLQVIAGCCIALPYVAVAVCVCVCVCVCIYIPIYVYISIYIYVYIYICIYIYVYIH